MANKTISSEIGRHFIVGLQSTELLPEEADLLRTLQPAGIIIFKRNIAQEEGWIPKLNSLITNAKAAINRPDLIVSLDHEGGKVHRLREPVTHFPAAINWQENSEAVGSAMGKELRALGFNLSFSPDLDIHSEPTNPVIGARAHATNASDVCTYASQFFYALQGQGVAACGKHFPGHGATTTDSHFSLPCLNLNKTELCSRDVIPFKHLISCGLQLIMSAHVLYPQIDPDYPATLSKRILTDLLRTELCFSGAVITDALEMKALSTVSAQTAAAQAVSAGVDFLLVAIPEGVVPVVHAYSLAKAIEQAAVGGAISAETLAESTERVTKFTSFVHSISAHQCPSMDVVGCKEHQTLCNSLSHK